MVTETAQQESVSWLEGEHFRFRLLQKTNTKQTKTKTVVMMGTLWLCVLLSSLVVAAAGSGSVGHAANATASAKWRPVVLMHGLVADKSHMKYTEGVCE